MTLLCCGLSLLTFAESATALVLHFLLLMLLLLSLLRLLLAMLTLLPLTNNRRCNAASCKLSVKFCLC